MPHELVLVVEDDDAARETASGGWSPISPEAEPLDGSRRAIRMPGFKPCVPPFLPRWITQ